MTNAPIVDITQLHSCDHHHHLSTLFTFSPGFLNRYPSRQFSQGLCRMLTEILINLGLTSARLMSSCWLPSNPTIVLIGLSSIWTQIRLRRYMSGWPCSLMTWPWVSTPLNRILAIQLTLSRDANLPITGTPREQATCRCPKLSASHSRRPSKS